MAKPCFATLNTAVCQNCFGAETRTTRHSNVYLATRASQSGPGGVPCIAAAAGDRRPLVTRARPRGESHAYPLVWPCGPRRERSRLHGSRLEERRYNADRCGKQLAPMPRRAALERVWWCALADARQGTARRPAPPGFGHKCQESKARPTGRACCGFWVGDGGSPTKKIQQRRKLRVRALLEQRARLRPSRRSVAGLSRSGWPRCLRDR